MQNVNTQSSENKIKTDIKSQWMKLKIEITRTQK